MKRRELPRMLLLPQSCFIACIGHVASQFLSKALSLHENILITHGHDHPFVTIRNILALREISADKAVLAKNALDKYTDNPNAYMRLGFCHLNPHSKEKLLEWSRNNFKEFKIPEEFLDFILKSDNRMTLYGEKLGPVLLIKELVEFANNKKIKLFGNVHGFNLKNIVSKKLPRKAKVITVTRDPIKRYLSHIHVKQSIYNFSDGYKMKEFFRDESIIEHYQSKYKDFEDNLFSRAIVHDLKQKKIMDCWIQEIELAQKHGIKIYKAEDLLNCEEWVYRDLLEEISGGKLSYSDEWMDMVIKLKQSGQDRRRKGNEGNEKTSREVFESLPKWAQCEIKEFFSHHSIHRKYYEDMGYDLSYSFLCDCI